MNDNNSISTPYPSEQFKKISDDGSHLFELISQFMDAAEAMKGDRRDELGDLLAIVKTDAQKIKAFVVSEIILGQLGGE